MKYKYAIFLGVVALVGFQTQANAASISLGTASDFAVIAGSTVTNTGPSTVTGNLGVSPGTVVTGFPPGTINGSIHVADATAAQAQTDATAAYNSIASLGYDQDLTGQDLGGLVLTPGTYYFASSAQLTGALTLDNLGDPNGLFIFQIGSTLTTASNASVLMNGGDNLNVFWQVGSSATLGTNTQFTGNILALSSITLTTGANIECGRALAQNGAVTMDTNTVTNVCATAVSEPNLSPVMLSIGLMSLLFVFKKKGMTSPVL